MPTNTGDRDDAVFERLPKRLEHRTRELWELVQQKYAPVREIRNVARSGLTLEDRRAYAHVICSACLASR